MANRHKRVDFRVVFHVAGDNGSVIRRRGKTSGKICDRQRNSHCRWFLSGGFDLAVASSVLIKNSLGSMGIVLMISVIFDPLVLLICVNLLLRLTAAITQPFGDSKIADFLEETAENLNYFTAGLLFTAFLYFISMMLMIYSTEALF